MKNGEDLGVGDGSDVVIVGDSWMNDSQGVAHTLKESSGQPYRAYARPGARLLDSSEAGIAAMYSEARQQNPVVSTVVMNGGINDIGMMPGLVADCSAMGDACQRVYGDLLDRLSGLWSHMAQDGVRDIVYIQYSDTQQNEVDFRLTDGDSLECRCSEVPAPARCHLLKTGDVVMGDLHDGLHPSTVAYQRIGNAVHALMQERGMRR